MVEDIPFITSVLPRTPDSGCARFSDWPPPPQCRALPWIPKTAVKPPGTLLCADPWSVCHPGPQNLQQAHFRPAAPYPGVILGPGSEGLTPMPPLTRLCKLPAPAYNLHPIAGPSHAGPFTVRRPEGTFALASQGTHSLGLA